MEPILLAYVGIALMTGLTFIGSGCTKELIVQRAILME